ncbi:MAG: 3-isopropylmalate dehydratase small subunit [Methanomicrobia archaeon]|nr:3-isopropylmalate dehydratase small subunit [Methanomicrobia archaeon]RLF96450.1 MAG: 3-isopropylmalate dehydratase [Thermococci archaeon]RLG01164.1 MAG: 3-isopropylmalate dehydratase [Thermococci archaeon]HDN81601.1 3-isopropylmalate dehydratase small subunit [Methanomicrobia archaeon]
MIKGKVFKYGDNVNTDVIYPGKYVYTIMDPEEMAEHALEDLDPDFVNNVNKGDIIVAGKNFGCGSSREQAVTCLKHAGVSAIIAKSFARIYYRNCINNGLIPVICKEASEYIKNGDVVSIDVLKGNIFVGDKEFNFVPFTEFIMEIIDSGGLLEYTKKVIKCTK